MKSVEILLPILFICCFFNLTKGDLSYKNYYGHPDKHHDKHHHKHHSSITINLTLCASKLDFLCISNEFYDQIIAYKTNITSITRSLKVKINSKIREFNQVAQETQKNWRLLVNNAVAILLLRIIERGPNTNAPLEFHPCLTAQLEETIKYQNSLVAAIDQCIAINNLTKSASESEIENFTNSAIDEADSVCDCVQNISIRSSETEKSAARTCARTAAGALSIDVIQSRADLVYQRFEVLVSKKTSSLESCFTESNDINPKLISIYGAINACNDGS